MTVRRRRFPTLMATLAAAAILAPTASPGAGTAPARYPTVYFVYTMNCTFTIQDDAGTTVSSIAPGNYQVDVRTPVAFGTVPLAAMGVNDMTACKGLAQFQLTGPGVNLSTSVYGGCLSDQAFTETFQPGATYTAQDNNQPSVTRTVLTTLTSGTPTPPPSYANASGADSSASTDIVGSAIVRPRGTLVGTLSANGTPTLTSKGKPVSTLEAGRYTFAITDRDQKGGFTIQAPKLGSTANLSGVEFVGTHKATVTLKAGRWMYYTGLGKTHPFVVTR